MNEPHVVAVGGSLRDVSYTRAALARVVDAAAAGGADAEQLDLRSFELPVYDADAHDAGDADAFRARMREADAVVLGTPVYHGTYSSALKTALDYCRMEEFEATPVGLLAVAGGRFPAATLAHLRETCRVLRADVLAHQVTLPEVGDLFAGGELVHEEYAGRVDDLGTAVVDAAARRGACPRESTVPG